MLQHKSEKMRSRIDLRKKVDKKSREGVQDDLRRGGGSPIQGLEGRPDKGWRDKGQGLRIDFDPMDTPLVLRGTVADIIITPYFAPETLE